MGKKTDHVISEYYEMYKIAKQRDEITCIPSFTVLASFYLEMQNTFLGIFKGKKLPYKCRYIHDKAMT